MSRITVRLNEKELQALIRLAEKERRHPREQAAYIIRTTLVQFGLLKDDTNTRVTSVGTPAPRAEVAQC